MQHRVLTVGTGLIGTEYARILTAQGHEIEAVGRGEASAKAFAEATGRAAQIGGIASWLDRNDVRAFDTAVVAVPVEDLATTTVLLMEAGVRKLLVEKPGGCFPAEVRGVAERAEQLGADVRVAYNRRFHASTQEARRRIADDGGATSFLFEFTEWSHKIEPLPKPAAVKRNWLLANSSHVIDLAFFLGGEPGAMTGYVNGALSWHRNAAFAGAGQTVTGVPFAYHANWAAPGRWWVEVMTGRNRYILRPLEELLVQPLGSIAIDKLAVDDALDRQFKPGFYREIEAFLGGGDGLPTIQEVADRLRWLSIINPES